MTSSLADDRPFWERKSLEEMTQTEWESLCDQCGRCCLETLGTDDGHEVYALDVACDLLHPVTGACGDYPNRFAKVPQCFKLTPATLDDLGIVPTTCAYDLIRKGKGLPWWHPLVSGDMETVRQAGVSVVGRVVPAHLAGHREFHTVDWPARDVSRDPAQAWRLARFGGVNAAVPTPFGVDGRVDPDLMAAHCFWLLANGCTGLAILDHAGEVSSLTADERIGVLRALAARHVPVSKILLGIGPASLSETLRIAEAAVELGVRGVLLAQIMRARALPREMLPQAFGELAQRYADRLLIYLSLSASQATHPATLTALRAIPAGCLTGVRVEAAGAQPTFNYTQQLRSAGLEVYTGSGHVLSGLMPMGAAGVIGPCVNLFSRLCSQIIDPDTPALGDRARQAVEAGCQALASRPKVPAIKALLARHTGHHAWNRVRLPLRAPRGRDNDALFQAFDRTGIRLPPLPPSAHPD